MLIDHHCFGRIRRSVPNLLCPCCCSGRQIHRNTFAGATGSEIFDIIPKTVVGKDLKIHNIRFTNLLNNISRFELGDLYRIAALIDVDEKVILELAHNQYINDKKSKRKK